MSFGPNCLVWGTPSRDSSGSMPLGNGDIGINLWVEPNGDVVFYIGKTDTWGEFGQLYKVGRIRLALRAGCGRIFPGENFRWELRLLEGLMVVRSEFGVLKVWVDANWPCIHLLAEGPSTLTGEISIEIWRKFKRELNGREQHGLHTGSPYAVWHGEDSIACLEEDAIAWFHYNQHSTWRSCLEMQGLGDFADGAEDPLYHRIFGGYVKGRNLRKVNETILATRVAESVFCADVTLLTLSNTPPELWLERIRSIAHAVPDAEDAEAFERHANWWRNFWRRSWIRVDGNEAARKVTESYELQRFLNACSGRGAFPIKFNGSIFNVDWGIEGEAFDADYRRWGPGYWHQNTRLPYWAMLMSGDFDLMRPYFKMYRDALPLEMERCRKYCGHEGAFFPETIYFWGAYLEHNYGWAEEREAGLAAHLPQNRYIRYHNSGGLELVYHALEFYRYTLDEEFLFSTLLPLAEAVIDYYDLHFPRCDGKLVIAPAQVIEQWFVAKNPMPEIAGLYACLEALLKLDERFVSARRRSGWERLLGELPDLPTRMIHGKKNFAPAEWWEGPPRNVENPELYAVFPYRRCGLGGGELEVGIETYRNRAYKHESGWAQDGIQAALMGLAEDARQSVTIRFTSGSPYARFPAFWGPYDWIPDQDHGACASYTLQLMCLQEWRDLLYGFPAWPAEWSVEFCLHAPNGNIVHGNYSPGDAPKIFAERPASFAPIPNFKR
ncbi:MAG: DUF5703 domain-containing protein [Chthoniobacterales bacterium]|nr:DUF5703 domain-containing protein [Chthoniobacterales bacterium]